MKQSRQEGGRHSSVNLSASTIIAAPGSNPMHNNYVFFNLYLNCDAERTKINKRPGVTHY